MTISCWHKWIQRTIEMALASETQVPIQRQSHASDPEDRANMMAERYIQLLELPCLSVGPFVTELWTRIIDMCIMHIVHHTHIYQGQGSRIIDTRIIHTCIMHTRDARPAENLAAPPREKQALPRPAPQKLTKPAGRNGAKLTVDCTDYAHTFGLRVVK